MNLPKAKTPFHFHSRVSLTVATGLKARSLAQLLEGIRSVPESVLYTHTHRFLQQHQFLVPEPSNDFAGWVSEALQDEELAEKLIAIDTVRYETLAGLRQDLVAVLEGHVRKRPEVRAAPPGAEFHFMRSVRFSLPTPYKAHDLAEFRDALKKISLGSLYLHVFEARLRPPLGVNDFSVWFEADLGEGGLAKKVAALDPYGQTLEALRERVVAMVQDRIGGIADA